MKIKTLINIFVIRMSRFIQSKADKKALLLNLPISKMSENPNIKDKIIQVNGENQLLIIVKWYFL